MILPSNYLQSRLGSVLLIAFLMLAYSFPTFAVYPNNTYSVAESKKDLQHLKSLLSKAHPNLYAHRSPKQLNAKFGKIISSVKRRQTDGEMEILVQRMLAAVCDEHTRINLMHRYKTSEFAKARFFGGQLIATQGDLILEPDLVSREALRAISINGRSTEEIRTFLREIVSRDGCVGDGAVFTRFQSLDTQIHLGNFLGIRPRHVVRTSENFPTPGRSLAFLYHQNIKKNEDYRSMWLKSLSMPPSKNVFLSKGRSNPTGIFEIHSPDWRYAYVHVRHFLGGKVQAQEIDKVMRRIIKNKPQHLILDLSENPGGEVGLASRLLSYFLNSSHQVAANIYRRSRQYRQNKSFMAVSSARLKSNRRFVRQFRKVRRKRGLYTLRVRRISFGHPSYKGKLTVLVSPLTHSAATMSALILKGKRKATIVGHQDGSSTTTSCFAAVGTYTLPISKIKVNIAETCFKRKRFKGERGKRLVPDIAVDPFGQESSNLLGATLKAGVLNVLRSRKSSKSKR